MAVRTRALALQYRHPSVAVVYFAGLMVLLFTHPLYRWMAAAGIAALAVLCVGRSPLLRACRFILPMALLFGLINPLFDHRGVHIWFYLFGNPITREAVLFGLNQGLLLVSVMVLFMSFNKVLDTAAFLYLFARFLPRAALLLGLAYQTTARLRQRAVEMAETQQARGLPYKKKIQTAAWFLGLFTRRSLEEGMETAIALRARDYGAARRSRYRAYRFTWKDAAGLAGLGAALCLAPRSSAAYAFFLCWPLLLELFQTVRAYGH